MPTPTQAFRAAIEAAAQGARINAAREPLLVPTLFLIQPTGQIKMVLWAHDEQLYNSVEYVRERIVKPNQAIGLVFIAETDMHDRSGNALDGVLVYGFLSSYRGTNPRTEARTFALDARRNLIPMRMNIPSKLTAWVRAALSDGEPTSD